MSYDFLSLERKFDGYPPSPRGTLFTVNGTAEPDPLGAGFAGDVGRGVNDELWRWQPIGYPAATFPMGPSVEAGRREVIDQINRNPGPIALAGYSQGALVTCTVWRDDILNPAGELHHRLQNVVGIVNFGDPMRCPGIANGNKYAGQPLPKKASGYTTGGIAGPGCLKPEETPAFLLSFANDGDLYASSPVGDSPWTNESQVGKYQTLIFNLIQEFDGTDIMDFAIAAAKILKQPLMQVLPLAMALINGLVFFGQGVSAPHWRYDAAPAIRFLNEAITR